MPIDSPFVIATCDVCGVETDPMELCPLSGGCYDMRNIPAKLKRWGWKIDGDKTICEECAEDAPNA